MALRLEVLSDHRHLLGEAARIVFGVGGGGFGRAADNDWVLPDPHRYLSGHHARIHFRQGAWYLEDVSTNGTYVNGSQLPVSRTGPCLLKDGDLIRFGEYEVRVSIDAADAAPTGASSIISRSPSGTSVERVMPVRVGGAAEDLGASLDFDALLHTDGGSLPDPAALAPTPAAARLQRLRAAARARLDGGLGGGLGLPHDLRSSMQAFCRGAGIDARSLPPDAEMRLIHLAGQLLREMVLGLQEVARSRIDFRHNYLVDETQDGSGAPDLSRLAADDYLLKLFAGHERHEFDALLLLREELKLAARHQQAVAGAVPEAFTSFLRHISPDEIQSRFEAAGARVGAASPWDLYAEIFRNLTQLTGGNLPHLFAEALAQSYLSLLKRPEE